MAGETLLTMVGNLTADPEIRTTAKGIRVVNFTIASTPRIYNRQSNQWEEGATLFMRCQAWYDLADHIANSLTKGMRVIAQGRLSQNSYQAQDGSNRTVVQLTVEEIGPSLRYATAQVQRSMSSNGFSGGYNNGGGNGGYQQNQAPNNAQGGYQNPSGYSGGAAYHQSGNADPWANSSSHNGGSFTNFGGNSEFSSDDDEPEF